MTGRSEITTPETLEEDAVAEPSLRPQRLDEFKPSDARSDSFYKDDRNIGLWAQKRASQLGLDLGESFQETLEKGRSKKILDNL